MHRNLTRHRCQALRSWRGSAAALSVLVALALAPVSAQALTGQDSGGRPAGTLSHNGQANVAGGSFGVAAKYTGGVGDTWYNTWANDGNIYATSNDTTGFNGTCNSDIAINELVGSDPTQLTAPFVNCMTSFGHRADVGQDPDGCSWKSGGIISVGGTLYLSVSRQGWTGQCQNESNGEQLALNGSIVKSTDDGRTWSNGFGTTNDPGGAAPQWDPSLDRVEAMFPGQAFSAPFFVNYGQDDAAASTADAADQYVYAVSDDGYAYDGNYLILGRVPRATIGDLNAANWQFYTGQPGGNGMDPKNWSSNVSTATHILTAAHQISQPDIQYLPALHEYLMASFSFPFSTTWPSNGTAHSSTFQFYAAPHPWGPWTRFLSKPTNMTVCYLTCAPRNTMPLGLYDPTLVSKFDRVNGLSDTIFTSGDFTSQSRYDDTKLYALHALPFTLSSPLYDLRDDTSPSISYQGSWASSTYLSFGTGDYADDFDSTLHSTNQTGGSVSFSFTGSTIQWIGTTESDNGYASVSIDGGPATQVDTYSPTSVHQVTLFGRTDLGPGRHTISIRATGNKDSASSNTYIDVDAFVTAR